jgi:hypothetical protein
MNNTLRYERGDRGLIPFGGTNGFSFSRTNSFSILLNEFTNALVVVQDFVGVY